MPYIINTTNGTEIATIADGTINTTTDLTLIGKNYAGYGEILNENFVKLLENFANSSGNPPGSPLPGQLWFDTTNSSIKLYISNPIGFKPLAKIISSASAPVNNTIGDLWWDSTNGQLKVFNGTGFTTIGPVASPEFGNTGAQPESIADNAAGTHFVVSLYSASTRVAIVSKDPEFTPSPAITGFATIKPGINLASSGTISGIQMTGTASNADLLDNLNNTEFIRANANATTSGTFGVLNDTGLAVGVDSDFRVSVSGVNVTLSNQSTNGNLSLKVAGNASPAITINGTTGLATVLANPTTGLGIATKQYVDNVSAAGSALQRDGTNTITGVITPSTTGNINFGSSSLRFAEVFATTFNSSTSTITGNTASTSTTSGALTITGGAGVGGNVHVGGVVRVNGSVASTSISSGTIVIPGSGGLGVAGNIFAGGSVRFEAGTASTSTSTGTLVVTGGAGVTGNIFAGGTAVRFTGNAASTSTSTGTLVVTGGVGVSGNIYVGGTMVGTATQAQYADMAERFEADQYYPAGTVVALGGAAEITAAVEELSDEVFGVISTRAAHLMNAAAGTDETHPPVALSGRVPVRVRGKVKKGDRLVSAGDGLARAADRNEITAFNVIGRALESKTTEGEGSIVAVVLLNS